MRSRSVSIAFAAAVVLVGVAFWPVRTRVGVNYEVSQQRLPLWEKAWRFMDRHRRTTELAQRLGDPIPEPEERTLALLAWTRQHIQPHPPDAAIVDDHVWSIIKRGYGSNDQMADVFTTLLTYTGVPAWWRLIGPDRPQYPVSFALIDGAWRVFDVERGIAFRDSAGNLATMESVAVDSQIVWKAAESAGIAPSAYVRRFRRFAPTPPPPILRAELQIPWRRVRHELKKALRPVR